MTPHPLPLRLCCSLLALLILAGCAQAPIHSPAPPAAPAAWTATTPSASPDPAHGDALLTPELRALLARAEAANRDLAAAGLRLKQSQLQQQLGGLRFTPSASLSHGASRPVEPQSSTRFVDVGGISVPVTSQQGWSRSYGASVGVGWEWDVWDRLAQGRAAAAAQTEAAQADVAAARAQLRQQVAERYWTLRLLAAQRPLLARQRELAEDILQRVRLRVQEGKLLPIEVDRAAASLQQTQVRLTDLDADTLLQRQQLALLLDEALPGPQLATERPEGELPALPALTLPAPAEVLARRPELQRARALVDAALARLRVSQAQRYPSLSFSAGLSTGGGSASDWLAQPLLSLAANLVVPLIDWQRLDLQQDSARTELELAALQLRDQVARSLAEVEGLLVENQRLRGQQAANQLRLREATQAARQAALRHELGTISRADWLQLEVARLEAEVGALQLQLRERLQRVQLVRAAAQ